jgi:hypothetical protein
MHNMLYDNLPSELLFPVSTCPSFSSDKDAKGCKF